MCQEATVRNLHGKLTGSKSGREYVKAVYCYRAYLTYMQSYVMRNARLDEAQAGIKLPGEISITSDMQMTTPFMAEIEELKALLMKLKEESEKAGLKLNIQKMKIMASSSITSWEIDGETVETVADFTLGGFKSLQLVTAAMKLKDTYSLEEKL